jgi:septum formation topological specificity factor MinE
MNDTDAIQMMQRCAEEIRILRRINADLAPKADAYDTVRTVLNLLPQRRQGHAPDLVWQLDKEIAELQAKKVPVADDQVPTA